MIPFNYRPEDPDVTDWEDNWISNAMAWASDVSGISDSDWPSTLANPFWTDCPTCLFWRGVFVGVTLTAMAGFCAFAMTIGY